ncbi:MAG: hypothetical protein VXW65_04620 [Pseudomonadota bacterium]|nr:hypothetical protein [Pseudomonadota bacterium]
MRNRTNIAILCAISLGVVGCSSKKAIPEPTDQVITPVIHAQQKPLPLGKSSDDPILSSLEQAVRSNAEDGLSWSLLSLVYFEREKYAKAIHAGTEATRLDPSNNDAKNIVLSASLKLAEQELQSMKSKNLIKPDAHALAKKTLVDMSQIINGK